jgi:hypothetical protein
MTNVSYRGNARRSPTSSPAMLPTMFSNLSDALPHAEAARSACSR